MFKRINLFFIILLLSCNYKNQCLNEKTINDNNIYNVDCYDINCFINKLVVEDSFSKEYLNYFFSHVIFQSNIIDIMEKPYTSVPWYKFIENNVNRKKILEGISFYLDNKNILDEVYQKYKIPPEIIVATLGVETNYGKYQGNFNVADSLYTLAFYYPRRTKYFQQELREYLLMVRKNHFDPFSLKGSYAGAMGYPQFMPSSFNRYAKSYHNLGFPNIWNNVADAILSIANYYNHQGWVDKGLVMVEVKLIPNDILENIMDEKASLKHTIKDLKKLGIIISNEIDDSQKVILFKLEVSDGIYKYYIGLNNFYVIWKYNNSKNYVAAVYNVSQAIKQNLYK